MSELIERLRRVRGGAALALGMVLLLSLFPLSLAGTGKQRFAGAPVSEVIFPPQRIPLRFSHVLHLKGTDLECDFCHESAPGSRSSVDNLMPREAQCTYCHAIDRSRPTKQVPAGKPPARCDACHPGYVAGSKQVERISLPHPNLKFDHKVHVDRKIACETCHGDLAAERVELATRDQLPKMSLCLTCHDGRKAPAACTTCHLSEAGGFVRTRYDSGVLQPSGVLRGDRHDLGFRTAHRFAAQNDEAYCQSCHRKEFCIECHNGVVKPMDFHGNDYISLHPIEARRNSPDCTACHRLQTFCVGCHSRSGVSSDGRAFVYGSRRLEERPLFHPDGWVTYEDMNPNDDVPPDLSRTRGASHHSFEAQRNIRQCASCHREDFCLPCHSTQTGSFNISPHPASWKGSNRCRSLAARAGRMCLRCHVSGAGCE